MLVRTAVFVFNVRILPTDFILCFMQSSEQTAIITLNCINSLVFVTQITETQIFSIGSGLILCIMLKKYDK